MDRFVRLTENLAKEKILRYKRFVAVDKNLLAKEDLPVDFQLIGKNWRNPYGSHNNYRSVVGCALSHYYLWNILVEQQKKHKEKDKKEQEEKEEKERRDYWIILEDDVQFVSGFLEKMKHLQEQLECHSETRDWDIIFLGWHDSHYRLGEDKDVIPKLLYKFDGDTIRTFGAGAFAYMIRAKGALKLLQLAQKDHIQQPIDWFLFDNFHRLNVYGLNENLVTSQVAKNSTMDSDIQFDYEKIPSL
jgi:GR25 family glycosyltransferase involved in LPS biosynthesis